MTMRIRYESDPKAFLARVQSFLTEREAENNLPLGLLAGIIDGVQIYSDEPPLLATIEDEKGIHLVALRTPPMNVVLSTAASDEAAPMLARELYAARQQIPGVVAPSHEAEQFAAAWNQLAGTRTRRVQSQRIYRLDRVIAPANVRGHLRRCEESDRTLVSEWLLAFNRDIGEHDVPADPNRFIGRPNEGLFLWIDEHPVSMAGFSGPTPNGIRIGRVYTPPQLRGRGYASACVAALSQHLLDSGRNFCFLYTDLANPVSNHIYQEIGYRPVCDATALKFDPA
jgi:predicted GNAT family acetyltransferase